MIITFKAMKADELNEPVNRLLQHGRNALSDSENLSLIIAGNNAKDRALGILKHVGYRYSELTRMNYQQLKALNLSHLQAIRLIAVVDFSQRKAMQTAEEKPCIRCSKDMFDIFQPLIAELPHEEFWIVFLNRSNKIMHKERMSQGGLSGTVTDVRLVMKRAIELSATGIVVSHNHPSGNLQPSESDTKITHKIKEAGNLMDVTLLDHIIVSDRDYYSFADNGLL
jgi:DNA repair protein RadC